MILVLKSVDRYEITNTSVMIQIVSHVLAYMNSCVNPILYAFLSDHFRKAFRKVINCGSAKNAHLGSRYHRGSAVQGQVNGRSPNIKNSHDDDNKSALLNVSKTTRLNGNSSRDIFWDARETNNAAISTSMAWKYAYTDRDTSSAYELVTCGFRAHYFCDNIPPTNQWCMIQHAKFPGIYDKLT
jgi:hypothetical protein